VVPDSIQKLWGAITSWGRDPPNREVGTDDESPWSDSAHVGAHLSWDMRPNTAFRKDNDLLGERAVSDQAKADTGLG